MSAQSNDTAIAEDKVPAPSFEEMPPVRGTILELIDISERFDGLLVEYHSTDKDSNKYYVEPLDETVTEGLRVEPRCVKRPAIKPRKLRVVLCNLSETGLDTNNEALLEKALEKDACCAPAYLSLGLLLHKKIIEHSNEEIENECKAKATMYYRRGFATAHMYDDLLPEADMRSYRTSYSSLLLDKGRVKAAMRLVNQGSRSSPSHLQAYHAFDDDFFTARALWERSEKARLKGYNSEHSKLIVKALEHCFKALRIAVSNWPDTSQSLIVHVHRQSAESCASFAFGCLVRLIDDAALMKQNCRDFDAASSQPQQNLCTMYRNLQHLGKELLDSCFGLERTIRFLDSGTINVCVMLVKTPLEEYPQLIDDLVKSDE